MGSKGSQTTNAVTNQSQTYNPAGASYLTGALQQAQNVAGQPQVVPTAPVAGLSGQQQQAFSLAGNTGVQNPYLQTAQNYFSPQGAQAFYNPMADAVTAQLQNIFGQQNSQNNAQLTQAAGGIGADRIAVGQGNLANQQGLAAGQTYANLYNTAVQQAQSAGYGSAALGSQAQQANLNDVNALLTTGGLQQQQQQAQLNAPYQQQLAQMALPYQQSQFLTGAVGSLAPALGGTTAGTGVTNTQSQYNPSLFSQILGGVGVGGALLGKGSGGAVPVFAGGGTVGPYAPHYDDGGLVAPVDVSKFMFVPTGGGGSAGAAASHQANLNLTPQVPTMGQQGQQGQQQGLDSLMKQAGKVGSAFSSPSWGGGNAFGDDAFGGTSANPLEGLSASDYGLGFEHGGGVDPDKMRRFDGHNPYRFFRGYADGGTPEDNQGHVYYSSPYGSITDADVDKAINLGTAFSGGGLGTRAASAAETSARFFNQHTVPPPLGFEERIWQNYAKNMSPEELWNSEAIWGSAARMAKEAGWKEHDAFAHLMNSMLQRKGMSANVTPEMAQDFMSKQLTDAALRDARSPHARGGRAGYDDGGNVTDEDRAIGYEMLRRGMGTRAPDSIPGGEPAPEPYRLAGPEAMQAWRQGVDDNPPETETASAVPVPRARSLGLPPEITGPEAAPTTMAFDRPQSGAGAPGPYAPSSAAQDQTATGAPATGADGYFGKLMASPWRMALLQAGLGAFTPQGFAGGLQQGMKTAQAQQTIAQSAKRLEQEAAFHEDAYKRETLAQRNAREQQERQFHVPHPMGQHIDPTTGMPITTYGLPQPDGTWKPVDTSVDNKPAQTDQASVKDWVPGQNVPEGVNPKALEGQSQAIANMVRAVDEGRMRLMDIPQRQRFMIQNLLHAYDGKWDETVWNLRNKQQGDMSTNGNAGKMVLAVNQLLPHLSTAFEHAEKLANTSYPEANTIKNWWLTATGDPRVKEFETVREVAAMDAARLLRGSGQMAEQDIEHWRQTLGAAGSPQQLQGVIRLLADDLMKARIDSIKQSYRMNMRQEPPDFVSPEAKEALGKITVKTASGQASSGQSPAAGATPGATPARSPQDQQALEWAAANPGDPRAAAIKKRLGVP